MSKFMAASRQATELDKMRILLETRIQEVNADCKKWAGLAAKAKDEVTENIKLIEELRTDALEKDLSYRSFAKDERRVKYLSLQSKRGRCG